MKMNAERLDDLLGMSTFKEFGRKKKWASFSELHTCFPHHFLFQLFGCSKDNR
jgi:hypothetical protein